MSLVHEMCFRRFLCWAVVGDRVVSWCDDLDVHCRLLMRCASGVFVVGDRVVSWCDDLDVHCHLLMRCASGFLFVVAVVLPNVLGCRLTC